MAGECFYKSCTFLLDLPQDALKDARLVHGLVDGQGPMDGIRFPHAWVEVSIGGCMFVWDPEAKALLQRHRYYEAGRIVEDELTRYTGAKAWMHVSQTGHAGPWEDRFDVWQNEALDELRKRA